KRLSRRRLSVWARRILSSARSICWRRWPLRVASSTRRSLRNCAGHIPGCMAHRAAGGARPSVGGVGGRGGGGGGGEAKRGGAWARTGGGAVVANRQGDGRVVTIAEVQRDEKAPAFATIQIVEHYEWVGMDYREQHLRLRDLLRGLWNCARLVIDASGIGAGL